MSIKANILPYFQYLTDGKSVVEVAGSTVAQCLDDLTNQFPGARTVLFDDNGALLTYVDVYVNGEGSYSEGLAKPVQEGDELHIVLLIDGG
jgi:molybdopterin converting factor small subunit